MGTVGVIGGGVAGLACARALAAAGLDVTVLDKGRRPGGRVATRRAGTDLAFDHGAPCFTARDDGFRAVAADWLARGVVAEWRGRFVRVEGGVTSDAAPEPRFVGVPGMSAVAADLASGLRVRVGARVVGAVRGPSGWSLATEDGGSAGPFDTLVVAVPAPQAAPLLGSHPFGAAAAAVAPAPCQAVMVAFARRLEVPWDGASVGGSPIAWAARNAAKPGRAADPDTWVLHAGPDWSTAHLEDDPDDVARALLDAFAAVVGGLPPALHLAAHRWRYARAADPADPGAWHDPDAALVVCGDWLSDGGVEGAWRSGVRAAAAVRARGPGGAAPGLDDGGPPVVSGRVG